MKFTSKFTAGLFCVGLLVAASAQDAVKFPVPGVTPTAAPAAAAPAAPKAKFTEAQIAEAYGWYMGAQMGLRQLEFTQEQIEAMARGMIGVAAGGTPSFDAKEIGPELEAFLGKKNEAFMAKLRSQQQAESSAHFTKLKENKNVVELPSGLRYEIVKAGTGTAPKLGQLVKFHYTGAFVNGQVFDSSVQRGEPAEMLLQEGGLIPGMIEGLQKVGPGGKIKLHIPGALAYGDNPDPRSGMPPGATLVFDVEVVSAKDAPKEAAAPAAK